MPSLVNQRRWLSGGQWVRLEEKADAIMSTLSSRNETVAVAETTSGGVLSAALWASPVGQVAFKGAGIRLAYGISREADEQAKKKTRDLASGPEAARWGLVYEDGVKHSESGTAEHALELAHAAKFNVGATWGIGESGIPGPEGHRRTGMPAGMCFVAVVGPTVETTGVLKLNPSDQQRSVNMARFAEAALDLMAVLQKRQDTGMPKEKNSGL
jgi:nicotinamide mononucleotide (NMN) deamidase PncC